MEGPVKSVKPRARNVASTLLMLRVQRGLVKKLIYFWAPHRSQAPRIAGSAGSVVTPPMK